MRALTTVCCASLASLVVACSNDNRWTGTVTDSAGVAVVHNPETGLWSPSDVWTFEEELRIGAVEGDPDYQFGQIGSVAADSRDRIYVLDTQAQHVQVFSSDGIFEQTVGGPGSGPGEIGPQAVTLLMGPGDTLLIPDLANQRVNRYTSDGTSLGSFRLTFEDGLPLAINATRTGTIAAQIHPLSLPGQPSPDSLDAVVILATDGSVLDTLKQFPSGRTVNLAGSSPEINVFAAEPVWQLTPDLHLCYGVNDQYRIELYSRDGVLERIITRSFSPRPITAGDQDMMWSFFKQQLGATLPPQALGPAMEQLRQITHFAEHYPAYARILIGPEGSLWVQHVPSPEVLTDEERVSWNFLEVLTGESWNLIEDIGSRDWDVFSSEGRFLGVVTMPANFSARTIAGDKIYGVWRDDLDVPYAVRLRIMGVTATD